MNGFTQLEGKYYQSPSLNTVEVVGGDVGQSLAVSEFISLKKADLLTVRVTLRTERMIRERMHPRASHVITLKEGGMEFLNELRSPDFNLGDIPITLVSQAAVMRGERAEDREGTGKVAAYLAKKATYKPLPGMAERGYYCHKNRRVAFVLNTGLIVVDDFGPKIAVHIVRCEALAKAMVRKEITIIEARKSPHHLSSIKHKEGYEHSVHKYLS